MTLPTYDLVSRPEHQGYGALIDWGPLNTDKLYLRLAVGQGRELQVQTKEPIELPGVGRDNPEDYSGSDGRVFSRNRFAGGEGLDSAHRRDGEERDWTRYWNSKGIHIDPSRPGIPEVLELAHETGETISSAATNLHMVKIGTDLYHSDTNKVLKTTNLGDSYDQNTRGGTVTGLAVLADTLYVGVGTHIEKNYTGYTTHSNVDNDGIWAAKGRLIAADGNLLYEVDTGDDSVLIHTLPDGATWTDVIDGGSAILASATDGTIYAFVEEEGNLVLKGETDMVREIPYSLGYLQGIVLIGTGQATSAGGKIGRLWRAQLVGVRLQAGQVVRTWGDGDETRDRVPYKIHTTRDEGFIGIVEDGSETHVWKYLAETDGITRDLVLNESGIVKGITSVDERIFASVSGGGIYREEATYETTGYLISPRADFYSSAVKNWVGARLDAEACVTQEAITLSYSNNPDALTDPNHASWTSAVAVSGGGTTQENDEQPLTAADGRYLLAKLTLASSTDQTTTPTVYAFSFRSLTTSEDEIIQIPVNVSDQIEIPHRKPLLVRGQGNLVWQKLRDIQGQDVRLEVLRPNPLEIRGVLESVTTPIASISERGSVTMYCLLTVRGLVIA
jgi:hypothetical protein